MKRFYIKTLGCKTNQLENEIIVNDLVHEGFEKVDDVEIADFFILNSCAVTENATNESLYFLKNIKHKFKNIKTVLTGCVAQLETKNLHDSDCIDFLIGNNEKLFISKYLLNSVNEAVADIFEQKIFNNKFITSVQRTRANLKIQDGCNNRCAYCTIPLARGNSRSNSIENIVKQIEIFVNSNIKEIILTGIHIGQWGQDFKTTSSLIDLLKEIEKTEILRYRLGSLDPLEITDELIEFLANSKKFCPHFHISLQSMCEKTLKNMNRRYTPEHALEIIDKLNKKFINPFLGCDIIVGFPDESDEDFETTYKNLKSAQLSQIHVFPYSIRKNTAAAAMTNQIDFKTKKIRADIVKKLSAEKYNSFLANNLNEISEVQIQKFKDKKTGFYKGLTRNYINILIDNPSLDICNKIVTAKLTKIYGNYILAEFIK